MTHCYLSREISDLFRSNEVLVSQLSMHLFPLHTSQKNIQNQIQLVTPHVSKALNGANHGNNYSE